MWENGWTIRQCGKNSDWARMMKRKSRPKCTNCWRTVSGLKDIAKKVKKGQLDGAEELMLTRGKQEIEREIPAGAEKVFERSGWDHISDFIGELPDLGNGKQKYFLFCVREGSPVIDFGFPTMVLAVMANAMDGGMTCKTALSDDGQNHFELFVK